MKIIKNKSDENILINDKVKRIISFILVALLIIETITITKAFADTTPNGLQYEEIDNGSISITGYSGDESSVIVPEKIDNKPVIEIGEHAFSSNDTIKTVELPSTCTTIGTGAFNSSSIRTLVLNSIELKEIGNYAFCYCMYFSKVKYSDELLEEINTQYENSTFLTTLIKNGNYINADIIGEEAFRESNIASRDVILGENTESNSNNTLSYGIFRDSDNYKDLYILNKSLLPYKNGSEYSYDMESFENLYIFKDSEFNAIKDDFEANCDQTLSYIDLSKECIVEDNTGKGLHKLSSIEEDELYDGSCIAECDNYRISYESSGLYYTITPTNSDNSVGFYVCFFNEDAATSNDLSVGKWYIYDTDNNMFIKYCGNFPYDKESLTSIYSQNIFDDVYNSFDNTKRSLNSLTNEELAQAEYLKDDNVWEIASGGDIGIEYNGLGFMINDSTGSNSSYYDYIVDDDFINNDEFAQEVGAKSYTWYLQNDEFSEYTGKCPFSASDFKDIYSEDIFNKVIKSFVPAAHTHDYVETITKEACAGQEGLKTYTCTICDDTYTKVIPKTDSHKYDSGKITKEACAGQEGIKTYTCTVCGDTYNEVIPKTNTHKYDNGKITKEPTCFEEGMKTYTCTVCGTSYTEILPKTNHQYGNVISNNDGTHSKTCSKCNDIVTEDCTYYSEKIEPTCVDDGYTKYTCSECGYSFKSDFVKATGHHDICSKSISYNIDRTKLKITETCSICGDENTYEVDITDNTLEYAYTENDDGNISITDSYIGKNCVDCDLLKVPSSIDGKTVTAIGENNSSKNAINDNSGVDIKFLIIPDTITKIYRGGVLVSSLRNISILNSDCELGYYSVTKSNYNDSSTFRFSVASYGNDNSASKYAAQNKCCSYDEESYIDLTNHAPLFGYCYDGKTFEDTCSDFKWTKTASCTEDGELVGTCKYCGEYTDYIIPAVGHYFDTSSYKIVSEPTCEKEGIVSSYCNNCNQYIENSIPALGHTEVTDIGKEPTCTETGLTEGSHCSRCGKILKEQKSIPATDHVFVKEIVEATKYGQGYTKYTCSECGYSYKTDYTDAVVKNLDELSLTVSYYKTKDDLENNKKSIYRLKKYKVYYDFYPCKIYIIAGEEDPEFENIKNTSYSYQTEISGYGSINKDFFGTWNILTDITIIFEGSIKNLDSLYLYDSNPNDIHLSYSKVIFEEGIETIGTIFQPGNCQNMNTIKKIYFPSTLKEVSENSFNKFKSSQGYVYCDSKYKDKIGNLPISSTLHYKDNIVRQNSIYTIYECDNCSAYSKKGSDAFTVSAGTGMKNRVNSPGVFEGMISYDNTNFTNKDKVEASYGNPFIVVSNYLELKNAIDNKEKYILIKSNIAIINPIKIDYAVTIVGLSDSSNNIPCLINHSSGSVLEIETEDNAAIQIDNVCIDNNNKETNAINVSNAKLQSYYLTVENSKSTGINLIDNSSISLIYSTIRNNENSGIRGDETSSIKINICDIYNNSSKNNGAGVFGKINQLIYSHIYNNISEKNGGGFYTIAKDNSAITNNIIENNVAKENGGGSYVEFDYDVYSIFSSDSSNSAQSSYLGYGLNNNPYLDFEENTISSNKANKNGGGIYVEDQRNLSEFPNEYFEITDYKTRNVDFDSMYYPNNVFAIFDSKITNNTALEDGGGIFSEQYFYVASVDFDSNVALKNGGAICSYSTVFFNYPILLRNGGAYLNYSSTFTSNSAYNGGAIYCERMEIAAEGLENSNIVFLEYGFSKYNFKENVALNNGGAIYAENSIYVQQNDSFLRCDYVKMSNNKAKSKGGAVYLEGKDITYGYNNQYTYPSNIYFFTYSNKFNNEYVYDNMADKGDSFYINGIYQLAYKEPSDYVGGYYTYPKTEDPNFSDSLIPDGFMLGNKGKICLVTDDDYIDKYNKAENIASSNIEVDSDYIHPGQILSTTLEEINAQYNNDDNQLKNISKYYDTNRFNLVNDDNCKIDVTKDNLHLYLNGNINVNYDVNNDKCTESIPSQNYLYSDGHVNLTAPALNDIQINDYVSYKFKKWNTKADGSGDTYKPEDTYSGMDDLTLYAIWEKEENYPTYIINYDVNNDKCTESINSQEFLYSNDSIVLTAPVLKEFTSDNKTYTFKEWNTNPDGSGTSILSEDIYNTPSDITYYAIWDVKNVPNTEIPIPDTTKPETKPETNEKTESNIETIINENNKMENNATVKTGGYLYDLIYICTAAGAIIFVLLLKKKKNINE